MTTFDCRLLAERMTEPGAALSPEETAHAASCPTCRAARAVVSELARTAAEPSAGSLARLARRTSPGETRRARAGLWAGAVAGLCGACAAAALLFWAPGAGHRGIPDGRETVAAADLDDPFGIEELAAPVDDLEAEEDEVD